MPFLTDSSNADDWIEPDKVPRPVVTYGIVSLDIRAIELEPHAHAKSQLMMVRRGALSCEVEGGLWIVPPGSAFWIPGGAIHSIRMTGALEGYNAFVATEVETHMPKTCCTVAVTPLLRELLLRTASLPLFYEEGGASSRLMTVLLDEIAAARVENLHLPMPSDPRLLRMVDRMMAAPGTRGTLSSWATQAGMSERSFMRLVTRETGMSFGRWRQQLCVVLAVKSLAAGAPIQRVAVDLGYESVPSFVTMFRKALGTSPGRYMAERHSHRDVHTSGSNWDCPVPQ